MKQNILKSIFFSLQIFVFVFFAHTNLFAQTKSADKIIGIVDNKIVLQSDVEIQINQMAVFKKILIDV